MSEGRGAQPAGTGRWYSQAAQGRAGAAHGARPRERGEPRRDHAGPRAAADARAEVGGERGRLEGGSLAAMPTRLRGSRGRSSWPRRAESLNAAAGAGGRWLFRIRSRRRVTGRQGG